jgi:hypothetical protein
LNPDFNDIRRIVFLSLDRGFSRCRKNLSSKPKAGLRPTMASAPPVFVKKALLDKFISSSKIHF